MNNQGLGGLDSPSAIDGREDFIEDLWAADLSGLQADPLCFLEKEKESLVG
jgi:hypothetical protein